MNLDVDEPRVAPRVGTVTHGHRKRADGKPSLTYKTWKNIQRRCYDPKHKTFDTYGGAGVRVYFRWLGAGGFAEFLHDVGERPSPAHHLDRIESSKHYEPGNVRWRLGALNCMTSIGAGDKLVKAQDPDGVWRELPLWRWAERLKITYRSLCKRLQRGMGPRAFSQRRR